MCIPVSVCMYPGLEPLAAQCSQTHTLYITNTIHIQFGNAGYTVRTNPTPRIPLGVPKWIPDGQIPVRYTLLEDRMVAK